METPEGEWYLTCLASRQFNGYDNLGRETFLAKVAWEDGWPVINPGEGKLLDEQEHGLPIVEVEQVSSYPLSESNPAFVHLRNPDWTHYDRDSRRGWLRLYPSTFSLKDQESPSYVGLRQPSMNFTLSVEMEEALKENEEAGLAIVQNDRYAIRLVVTTFEEKKEAQFITTIDEKDKVVGSIDLSGNAFELSLKGQDQSIKASVTVNGKELTVAENVDTHYLSTKVAGGFVGCTMGIYTTSKNEQTGYTDFRTLNLIKN